MSMDTYMVQAMRSLEKSWRWEKVSKESKLAFLSAVLAGFITHLYAFTNMLLSNDAINGMFTSNSHLTSGRWALGFFSKFSNSIQLPVISGIISIFMLACTAALTVYLLKVSCPVSIIFLAIFLVSYPSVACTFAYMYTADAYFIAVFLNVLAVYLVKKYRFGWLSAVVLLALACGIYQAYLGYAVGLLLFDCILSVLEEKKAKEVFIQGGKYIFVIISALVLYYGITKILLIRADKVLTAYQGMDTMGSIHLEEYFRTIPEAYKIFKNYYINGPFNIPGAKIAQDVMAVLSCTSIGIIVMLKKLWKNPVRLILLAVGVTMIPLALNLVTVLTYKGSIHALMIYAFVLQFAFEIKLIEFASQEIQQSDMKLKCICKRGLCVIATTCYMLLSWNHITTSNIYYQGLKLTYETSFALSNRILMHVEATDGFTVDTPISIIGTPSEELFGLREKNLGRITGFIVGYPDISELTRFIRICLGVDYTMAINEETKLLKESEIVKAMPTYPNRGSIAMVDGVIVVKLS